MDFALSESQEILQKVAREFLSRECSPDLVRRLEEDERGYDPEVWRRMAEMGWLGLPFPEEYGGSAGNFIDLAVLLEEMGRVPLPSPFIFTLLCGLAVLHFGSEVQKREILPPLIKGESILSLAVLEESAKYGPSAIRARAMRTGEGFCLEGVKLFVPFARSADRLICAFRTGEEERDITLFIAKTSSPGIEFTPLETIALDREDEVAFHEVRVAPEDVLGGVSRGWEPLREIIKWGAFFCTAFILGMAEQVLAMSTAYARERIQFERPIGSFQAIQHRCANMAIDVDASKFITYEAAWALSRGLPAYKEVAMAKAWVGEACHRVCMHGHQIHGGVGVVVEHPMQVYLRWSKLMEALFGDAEWHREIVAQETGL